MTHLMNTVFLILQALFVGCYRASVTFSQFLSTTCSTAWHWCLFLISSGALNAFSSVWILFTIYIHWNGSLSVFVKCAVLCWCWMLLGELSGFLSIEQDNTAAFSPLNCSTFWWAFLVKWAWANSSIIGSLTSRGGSCKIFCPVYSTGAVAEDWSGLFLQG